MELLKAQNLSYHNGSKTILENASFRILSNSKIGLIGPNGVGKTTLIRILINELEADKGQLFRSPDIHIGLLPQQPEFTGDMDIKTFLLAHQDHVKTRMSQCEKAMAETSPEKMEKLLEEYQQLLEEFEKLGGYEAEDKGENLLRRLGLDNSMDQSFMSLSGGEKSLVSFARALMGNPDLLILDEPGNHLDYLGLAWLESFIAGYPGAVLVVSHNRYLLDKSCTELWDMEAGSLKVFQGIYSDYRTEKFRALILQQSEYEYCMREKQRLTLKIKQLQSIAMAQYNPPARIMAELGAAKKVLGRIMERMPEKPPAMDTTIDIDFGDDSSKSRIALRVKDFSRSFGERRLFEKAGFEMRCGEKVALVGPNGSGKTTLIQAILEKGHWEHPHLKIGPSQKIGYLSQMPHYHPEAVSIIDEIRSWGPVSREQAAGLALKLNFTYQDLDKPLAVLSGGEVNRLQLGRLIYQNVNFLILDEPTNHMDIPSREHVEAALKDFAGTILVVSHDRFFLDQLVDRVVEIDNMKLKNHKGNFSAFFKVRYPVLPRMKGSVNLRAKEKKQADAKKIPTLQRLEDRIQEDETTKLTLQKELEQAYKQKNTSQGRQIANKLEKIMTRLEHLYKKWEDLI